MQLEQAKKIVIAICYKLQPFCDKINIAGSIRRAKPDVGDLEIVCLPKMVASGQESLFGDSAVTYTVNSGFIGTVHSLGTIIKGKPEGKYMQIELPEGINLDLFIPDDFDYYRQYVIRTGSADYVAKVIAGGWRKIGWCGSDKGLRRMADCIESKGTDGKSKWKCVRQDAELPPRWNSEREFFDWLQVPYVEPNKRNV